MIFICSFIILFVIFVVVMFLLTGGFIIFSNDTKPELTETQSEVYKSEPKIEPKVEKKSYINLNGQLIELLTKVEIAKAKRDGFDVVEQ